MSDLRKLLDPVWLVENLGYIRTQHNPLVKFKPWEWQREFLRILDKHDKVVLLKSRDIGASTVAVLYYTADTIINGGDFLIASYKKESAAFLYENVKVFIKNLPDVLKPVTELIEDTKHGLIIKSSGAHIKAVEMSPKVGRSFRAIRILASEVAHWKEPRKSWVALTGAGTKGVKICVESTPNPAPEGELFEEIYTNPEYYSCEYDWRVSPEHDEEWERKRRSELTDKEFAIEYECDLTKSSEGNNVIPISWVDGAITRIMKPEGEIVFGVDVARYGDDESVVVIRQGPKVLDIKTFRKIDTMEYAGRIKDLAEKYSPSKIIVDVIGVGSGVYDRLREQELPAVEFNSSEKAEDSERFANKRAESYFGLRERFKDGDIDIPNDRILRQQLTRQTYKFNSRGQIQIQSKEEIKKKYGWSPDRADALMMAFANVKKGKIGIYTDVNKEEIKKWESLINS